MTRRIHFLGRAVQDLDSQNEYIIDHESTETALSFLAAVNDTVRLIADHPAIGGPSVYEDRQLRRTRMFRVARFTKYLVFYRVGPRAIEIVRVLHGARDLENALDE